jgi:hypothetical protein
MTVELSREEHEAMETARAIHDAPDVDDFPCRCFEEGFEAAVAFMHEHAAAPVSVSVSERSEPEIPDGAVAIVQAPGGRNAYRGEPGCTNVTCTRDGNPDRCYGWHCGYCHGPSNCQGDCSCRAEGSE